ncbi:MAG: tryptophan synthase subunit alpha [Cytophagales bacterium]|nr:tryptophan synthase subunit alpha [Cytophagales bacterium]
MQMILTENRILKLFEKKRSRILSVYFSAGYPNLNDTAQIIRSLSDSGADLIEVGIPFSDPVADGPTIQESNKIALDNGISVKLIFEQLAEIREHVDTPIILMGYINPVIRFGVEAFCRNCREVGIDGLILPDLPMQEYLENYKSSFEAHGLLNIFLITPQTSGERIRAIDRNSRGFIYMVSSASTTGAKTGISQDQVRYFERIKEMKLDNPALIGFGISNKETFNTACRYASGAIIGSAFIHVLKNAENLRQDIRTFVKSVKE